MMNSSTPVTSSQTAPHPRLQETLQKHWQHPWQRPIAAHNRAAFDQIRTWLRDWKGPLILDTGCGTGLSSQNLARRFPEAVVIGIDKSADRLARSAPSPQPGQDRVRLFRMDLEDFWILALAEGWQFEHQAFFYPNPWPKPEQRLRRWPFHPVLPIALAGGGTWELRTNWPVYAQEMALAFAWATGVEAPVESWRPEHPETLFEKKYLASGHSLWRWQARVPEYWTRPLRPSDV